MFSMFRCCDPEPAEKPLLIYSSTDEHADHGALPNLLPSNSKEQTKHDLKEQTKHDVKEQTKHDLMPSAPPVEELAPAPPEPPKEPAPAPPPTLTRDDERPSAAPPEAPEEIDHTDRPSDLAEPEAETEATSPGVALREVAAAEDRVAQGEEPEERAPQTDNGASLEHLQEIVAEFSKKAVSGAPAVYINEKTAKRINVTYTMTSDLTQLTLAAEKKGIFSPFSLTVPIANIQDTDEFESCQDLLRPKLKASLTKDEKERFLMVFYEDKRGELKSFSLIEQSVESRTQFSTGLKTLASSMQE